MTLRPKTLHARQLRRDGTDVEKRLWRALRENFPNWKFRHQHPIGKRFVDFACPARRLAIELDGGQHDKQKGADALRSTELMSRGYRIIRFWNNEVSDNIEGVVEAIRLWLENSPPLPDPLRPNGAYGIHTSRIWIRKYQNRLAFDSFWKPRRGFPEMFAPALDGILRCVHAVAQWGREGEKMSPTPPPAADNTAPAPHSP